MFSDYIVKFKEDKLNLFEFNKEISEQDLNFVLDKVYNFDLLDTDDLNVLLNDTAWQYKRKLQEAADHITKQRHGRVIKFYAPLYISNECTNSCLYCGFNINNKFNRVTLSEKEILREAEVLKKMGIEHLLLVAGEDLVNVNMAYLRKISELTSKMFSTVSVEIAPLGEEQYRQLFDCGVEGVVCYQETYDKNLYSKYHPAGPKRDYINRLNTHDRAGKSGMRFLGIGALLGLGNYLHETLNIALHARYLQKKYWRSQISVSFPRIRPCEGGFNPENPVSEEQLLQIIVALRLFLPDANLVLSTRESMELRDIAVSYGINQISAGSRTNPLGYSESTNNNIKQFEIADHRSPEEIAGKYSRSGYDPVFKDWDKGFRNAD